MAAAALGGQWSGLELLQGGRAAYGSPGRCNVRRLREHLSGWDEDRFNCVPICEPD